MIDDLRLSKKCASRWFFRIPGRPSFIIFINDMRSFVCGSNAGNFADDTKISKRIDSVADHDMLQEDLESTISWSKRNNIYGAS